MHRHRAVYAVLDGAANSLNRPSRAAAVPAPRRQVPCPRSFASTSRLAADGADGQETPEQRKQREAHEERRKRARQEESKRREQEEGAPVGTTPWARFVEVLKEEYQKSRAFQENVRELSGKADGISDSAAAQRMRQAYTAMRLQNIIRENPRLSQMASSLSATGRSVSDVVNRTAKEIEDSALIQAAKKAAERMDKAMEPLRQTEAYKAVEDTVDFSQGALRYGGYIEKAERHRRRQKRLERLGRAERGMGVLGGPGSKAHKEILEKQAGASAAEAPIDLDAAAAADGPPDPSASASSSASTSASPAAGSQEPSTPANPAAAPALVWHSTANESTSSTSGRSRLSSITPEPIRRVLASLSEAYQESDNPVVGAMRSVTGAIGRFFDETETAKVVRWVKEMDPDFEMDGFLRDLREYVVPEIVDAYVGADLVTLKRWTSEGVRLIPGPTVPVPSADASLPGLQRHHGSHAALSSARSEA